MAKLKTVPPVPVVAEAPPAKSRLPLILGSIVLLLVACLGAGGFYWWSHRGGAAAEEHKQVEKKPPVFVTLDPFTVNLLPESGDHYLQVGVVYQVAEDKTVDALKLYMPVIRNRILLLLSGKKPSDLAQVDGKQKLVMELVIAARESLPGEAGSERGIAGAFLSAFVIQ
jgi:flagellar protein FliL